MFSKKKDKKREYKTIGVDYRMSGWDLFRILFMISLIVTPFGWSSILLLSMLYFISFSSLVVLLIYAHECKEQAEILSKWLYLILAGSLFFFALSMNKSNFLYMVGAYGSAGFSPIISYFILLKLFKYNPRLAEVFGYESE